MKNASKYRKVYMTYSGCAYDEKAAIQIYGECLENAPLVKVLLDKNGNVKGGW